MKKVLSLLTLFAYSFCGTVHGQNATVDNATSPNTATNNNTLNNSLSGNGGNGYNVDLYSGTVNVNIPIYNYSVDGIDAGISLGYNTGGIKVDQLASSAGLGWNLNAGASITRKVCGIEDEATLPAIGPYMYGKLQTPQMSGAWAFCDPQGVTTGNPESDNDVFTINFGNRSVDFILKFTNIPDFGSAIGPNQPFLVGTSNNANLHILPLVGGTGIYWASFPNNTNSSANTYRFGATMETDATTANALSFNVIDELGNQYFFERGDYEYKPYVDTTVTPRVTHMYYPADKWNLTKLITWKGTTILYHYRNFDNVRYPIQRSVAVKESQEYNSTSSTSTNYNIVPRLTILTDSIIYWSGTMTQISEIDYPNGVVATFNNDAVDRLDLTNANGLQSIKIEGKYDTHVDNSIVYNFNKSYFTTSPNVDQTNVYANHDEFGYRLKLNGIDRVGTDNATLEPYYRFTYNTATVLPQHCSPAQDIYGYYNNLGFGYLIYNPALNYNPGYGGYGGQAPWVVDGMADVYNYIPFHTFSYVYNSNNCSVSYGVSKESNVNTAQACILTNMTNGLGGTTSFSYKSHSLTNPPGDTYSLTSYYDIASASYKTVPTLTGPHYYADNGLCTIMPGNDNPMLDMEYTDVNDGVCIDKITTSDGYNTSNNTTTQYTFSGGMRFFPGGYYWYPTVTNWFIPSLLYPITPDANGNTDTRENGWLERIYTNTMVSSQDQINGACHGYSDATATTTGANGEQVSSRHIHFTNVISNAGEFDHISYDNQPASPNVYSPINLQPNVSRIRAACGLFEHTMPRLFMEKQLMGLPVEVDDYDRNGLTTHKTVNVYTEHSGGYGFFGTLPVSSPISTYWPTRLFSVNSNNSPTTTLHYPYAPFSPSVALLESSATTTYSGAGSIIVTQNYTYDTHDNLTSTSWIDSKGNAFNSNTAYTYQATNLDNTSHTVFKQVSNAVTKYIPGQGWGNVSGSGIAGQFYSTSIYGTGTPLYQISGAYATRGTDPFSVFSDYKNYTQFDVQNNVVETKYKNNQKVYSALWDTRIGQKVASVVNSAFTDMAYTSFEGAFTSGQDPNKGQWNFNETHVAYDPTMNPVTGKYYYLLIGIDQVNSVNNLVSGKQYYVSFWVNGPVPLVYTLGGGGSTFGASPTYASLSAKNTVNGWTLYSGYITGSGQPLYISYAYVYQASNPPTNTCMLDELRYYPANASMETFTYEPLLGVSSHCDDRDNVTYMEYDVQGRPTVTRDINKNIITLTKQVNQGNDN